MSGEDSNNRKNNFATEVSVLLRLIMHNPSLNFAKALKDTGSSPDQFARNWSNAGKPSDVGELLSSSLRGTSGIGLPQTRQNTTDSQSANKFCSSIKQIISDTSLYGVKNSEVPFAEEKANRWLHNRPLP